MKRGNSISHTDGATFDSNLLEEFFAPSPGEIATSTASAKPPAPGGLRAYWRLVSEKVLARATGCSPAGTES
jgi:hypothetical protein